MRFAGIDTERCRVPQDGRTRAKRRGRPHGVGPRRWRLIDVQFRLRVTVANELKCVVDGEMNVLGILVEPKLTPVEITGLRGGDCLDGIALSERIFRLYPEAIE